MKHRRVVWSLSAKKDLLDVWHYSAHIASPDIADTLVREIALTSARLKDEASMWRARDEILLGLRSVVVHPFTIFYRVNDGQVEIVRVLHERRDLATVFVHK